MDTSPLARLILVALGVCTASACTAINAFEDPVMVGEWRGRKESRNTLQVDLDGTGNATLHYVSSIDPGTSQRDKFSVRWEQQAEQKFELRLRCTTSTLSCAGNDFELVCKTNADGDEADCTTSNAVWKNYPFDWELD